MRTPRSAEAVSRQSGATPPCLRVSLQSKSGPRVAVDIFHVVLPGIWVMVELMDTRTHPQNNRKGSCFILSRVWFRHARLGCLPSSRLPPRHGARERTGCTADPGAGLQESEKCERQALPPPFGPVRLEHGLKGLELGVAAADLSASFRDDAPGRRLPSAARGPAGESDVCKCLRAGRDAQLAQVHPPHRLGDGPLQREARARRRRTR